MPNESDFARPSVAGVLLKASVGDINNSESVSQDTPIDERVSGANPQTGTPTQPPPDSLSAENRAGVARSLVVNHLMKIDNRLVILGNVIFDNECVELPWRRIKDGEPARMAEIAHEMEMVHAIYVHGLNQGPEVFREVCQLFIREDIQ